MNSFGWRAGRKGAQARRGEFLFGGAGGGTADLLAVDEEGTATVVFLEGERAAVREAGFGESDSWFHGA